MKPLQEYFKRAGLTSGPLSLKENTSHSAMGVTKNFLLGKKQFVGDESFLKLGNKLHEHLARIEDTKYRCEGFKELSKEEQETILDICKEVRKNKPLMELVKNTVREEKRYKLVHGVRMAYIIDVDNKKVSAILDWKSTSCNTEEDFVEKAFEYDYARQGELYRLAEKRTHVYFIGLRKKKPHKIFIMLLNLRYAEEVYYARQELKFLAYFTKQYGKTIIN